MQLSFSSQMHYSVKLLVIEVIYTFMCSLKKDKSRFVYIWVHAGDFALIY